MTRVSLKEAYDNKDVVAQIYAIRDIAEGAEDTANNAVSTANTASEHVDALVPQVEGAVQNANNASASAQTSAQTVTGYEDRLSNVELKITTAEGQIVTIQGRVTALETADGQNVKINNINDYAVGLTGNQPSIAGYKTFNKYITHSENGNQYGFVDQRTDINITNLTGTSYKNVLKVIDGDNNNLAVLEVRGYANGTTTLFVKVRNSDGSTKTVKLAEGDVI